MAGNIYAIILVLSIVFVVYLNKKIKVGQTSNEALAMHEKIITWIFGLAYPLIAVNGIMYYSLRKKYPTKAKEINKIGWISLLVVIGLYILSKVLGLLTSSI